jgi:transposase-like protein
VINTDKASCHGPAIAALKKEGLMARDTQHRQARYLNNRLEADHGKLKRLIKPTLGFQSLRTAHATIKGFEVMRALKKGQGSLFRYLPNVAGEVSLVNRTFGLC